MTEPAPTISPASDRANTFPWPPVLLFALPVAAWAAGRAVPVEWPGVDDGPARFVGLVFGVLGLGLIVWAIVTLRNSGTTVMPDQRSDALVTTGPFSFFRNPIYLGEVLLLLSAAEITKNVWFVVAALLFAVLVTRLQIVAEERHLEARFGDAYAEYKARTRRWI